MAEPSRRFVSPMRLDAVTDRARERDDWLAIVLDQMVADVQR